MSDEKKELSAKEKKAAAKAAKAARRAQKVEVNGGANEPEKKPEKKKEEQKSQKSQGQKAKSAEKTERHNSDNGPKNQQKNHVPTKTVTSQADLSEPVFTYMKNTFGVDETLNQLGFSLRNPFQKQKNTDQAAEQLHSAFVRLGIKSSQRVHDEPTERTLVLVEAIKQFISDFTESEELAHDRMTIGDQFTFRLKPNLNFLTKCRPFIKSEAFLIDHVKRVARDMTYDGLNLESFKEEMTDEIDMFWQNRVLNAQIIIQEKSADLIRDGHTIMTFGYSLTVYNIIEYAHKHSNFSVIVVDCEPDFAGEKMCKKLRALGIGVQYCTISGLSYMMDETDLIFLGAQSLLANGSVEVAKGAGIVALVAEEDQKPVLVCCETFKFNDRSAINALDNHNELGDSKVEFDTSVQYANIMYDVIPSSLVTAAITEVGTIPSTSVATILTENEMRNFNENT